MAELEGGYSSKALLQQSPKGSSPGRKESKLPRV